VPGIVTNLAFAAGRLFAVADNGTIMCFGKRRRTCMNANIHIWDAMV
jgi:hypothetical protein